MAVKVSFMPSKFDNSDDILVAQIVRRSTLDYDHVLNLMERGTALNKADMNLAVQRFKAVITEQLFLGNKVHTPLGVFSLGIQGGKHTVGDTLPKVTPDQLHIIFRPEPVLKNTINEKAEIEMIEYTGPQLPVINFLNNDDTRTTTTFHQGELCHLKGTRVSFDKKDPELGLFLQCKKSKKTYRIEVINHNGSSKIDFNFPTDIPPGTYTLTCKTRPKQKLRISKPYKDPITITEPTKSTTTK